jgi:hypothetical protein
LLKARNAEFLSLAILDKKKARYPSRLKGRVDTAPNPIHVMPLPQANRRCEHASYELELPALAGV